MADHNTDLAPIIAELEAMMRLRRKLAFLERAWPALGECLEDLPSDRSQANLAVLEAIDAAIDGIDDEPTATAARLLLAGTRRWRTLGDRQQDAALAYRGVGPDAFRRRRHDGRSHQEDVLAAVAIQLRRANSPAGLAQEPATPAATPPLEAQGEDGPSPHVSAAERTSPTPVHEVPGDREERSVLPRLALAATMVMAGGIALAMLWPSDEGDEGDEVAGDGVSEMVPSVATDVLSGETEESMCSWSVAELDDLESVVRQAHTDAGGAEEHGCPTGEVRRWHDVTILDLTSGPRGPGAIIIGTSGDAVVLDGPVLGAYLDPHGADAPLRIGHPIGDAVECTNGDRHLPLSATSSTPSALVTIDGTDSWRTVSGPAWTSHPCNPSPADSSQFCTPAGLVGPDSPSDASAFTTAIDSVAGPNDCFAGPIEALGAVLRFQPLTDPNGDRDGAVTVSSRTPAVRLSDAQWESYLRAASSGTDPGELASLAGIPASRTSTLDVSEVALDRSGKILGAADDQPHFFSPSLVINQWEAAGGPAGPHGLPIAGVSFGDGRLEQAFEGGSFVLDATGVLGFDEAPPADPFPLEPEHEGGLLISDRGDAFLVQGGRLSWVAPSDVDDCWGGASNTIVRDHPKRALIQMRKGPQARCADSPNFRSIDDASFCSRQLGDTAVVHRTSDPEAWECTTSRESEQIDLADLCNRQHGALAVPFTRTPSDVGTWTCKIERS